MTEDSIGLIFRKTSSTHTDLATVRRKAFTIRWTACGNSSVGSACPVVFEATGVYHRRLARVLAGRRPLVKVNLYQARRFVQAAGVRAKTDRVDARMLARMGEAMALQPDPGRSAQPAS